MPLPVNVDSTYADDPGDASAQLHQQHHDALHEFYNLHEGIRPMSNVSVQDVGGNITLAVSAAWKDVEDNTGGGGSASARGLDVVLPDMVIGDAFVVRPVMNVGSSTGGFLMNATIYVAGVVVRRLFDATFGYVPWSLGANVSRDLVDWSPRQVVQAGDLEADGSLRVRFQYILATAARTLGATNSVPAWSEGRGPLA